MIEVSDEYLNLAQKRIRPKCESMITVTGVDNTGKETTLIWNSKDIKSFKYKRGVDPIGRELPYMELTWTEIYTGSFNKVAYPEKYENVVKYMAVEIAFEQDLSFYRTWKELFESATTWKELLEKAATWKELKKPSKYRIVCPKLFLTAKPEIKGQTITWTAKDLLFFLDSTVSVAYLPTRYGSHPYLDFIVSELEDIKTNWINSPNIYEAINATKINLEKTQEIIGDSLGDTESLVSSDTFKNFVLNMATAGSYFFKYELDGSFNFLRTYSISQGSPLHNIPSDIMFKRPTLTQGVNISTYEYNIYSYDIEESQNYEQEPYGYDDELGYYLFKFKRPGEVLDRYNPNRDYARTFFEAYAEGADPLVVTPFVASASKQKHNTGYIGESFIEDNPTKVSARKSREEFLLEYFKETSLDIECECLPNLSIEPCDAPYIETGLGTGEAKDRRQFVVVSTEINYNGSYKEKIKAHELSVGSG